MIKKIVKKKVIFGGKSFLMKKKVLVTIVTTVTTVRNVATVTTVTTVTTVKNVTNIINVTTVSLGGRKVGFNYLLIL